MGKLIMVRKGNGQGMQSRPCFHPGHTLLHITNTLYSVLLFMYSTVNNKTERVGFGNQVVQTLNICKQKLILLLLQLELIILMSTPHLTLSEISRIRTWNYCLTIPMTPLRLFFYNYFHTENYYRESFTGQCIYNEFHLDWVRNCSFSKFPEHFHNNFSFIEEI